MCTYDVVFFFCFLLLQELARLKSEVKARDDAIREKQVRIIATQVVSRH